VAHSPASRVLREALGIQEGDQLAFRVEGARAALARTPDFVSLAGSVPVLLHLGNGEARTAQKGTYLLGSPVAVAVQVRRVA
jgi:bifunctional DNA-binding transcriptional regulator/antitoxin component of YhaV-PrlF toxin-antitoxin module